MVFGTVQVGCSPDGLTVHCSGEALSSLCEVAGELEVVTKTKEDAVGQRLLYSNTGELRSQVNVYHVTASVWKLTQ